MMDIGTMFNFDGNFTQQLLLENEFNFQIPKYLLHKDYGKLRIWLMDFGNSNNAQKYVEQLSEKIPLSAKAFYSSDTSYFNENGIICYKAITGPSNNIDTEILCNKNNIVFYLLKQSPVTGLEDAYKSIIKKIPKENEGGGCLIATATYGSEMALEVQQLRELRDNTLLQTQSGTQFMQYFNDVYYSFSPVIADYERENPLFKEAVKLTITPMISSLSILNYVDMDSEKSVLGYGISLILLNLGMYLGIPAIVIVGIRKKF
jgi:hypothetical protein